MTDPIKDVDLKAVHDYSQREEQAIVGRFFQRTRSEYATFFVDVGAYDGITGSNTRLLAELGWGGILIEPTPEAFSRLQALYADNARVRCLRCAISDHDAKAAEMLVSEGPAGTPAESAWHYSQVSTLNPWFAEGFIKEHGYRYRSIEVEVHSLLDILRESDCPQDLGLLSIDCEGEDLRILRAFDFEEFRPRVLSVESDDRNRSQFSEHLEPCGYVEYDNTPCNTFFRRRD